MWLLRQHSSGPTARCRSTRRFAGYPTPSPRPIERELPARPACCTRRRSSAFSFGPESRRTTRALMRSLSTGCCGSVRSPGARRTSYLREAQDHLSAALSLRGDTTPEDRARLGALVLARGELESALEHADRALQDLGDWQGGGPLPPIEAANVYLAAGRSHPTVEILERSWGEDTYAVPDPESGDYIQAGSVLGTLGALRALGLTGGEGWEIEQRFAALERAWSVPEYSRRELALLRLYFLREVSPALARIPERWAGWFEGWDEHGLEIPAIWRGLLVAEAHPEEARRHLQEGIRELEGRRSQRLRAVHFLMPIVLARRIEADSIAADLSVRAGACPLAVNGIDFGWGMEESLAGSLEELAEP